MIRSYQVVELATTPKELRRIADRMEQEWSKCHPGDEIPRFKFIDKDGVHVHLVVNQDMIGKERPYSPLQNPNEVTVTFSGPPGSGKSTLLMMLATYATMRGIWEVVRSKDNGVHELILRRRNPSP